MDLITWVATKHLSNSERPNRRIHKTVHNYLSSGKERDHLGQREKGWVYWRNGIQTGQVLRKDIRKIQYFT